MSESKSNEVKNVKSESSGFSIWNLLIWIFAIYGGLLLIDKYVFNITLVDKVQSGLFDKKTSQTSETVNDNISVTEPPMEESKSQDVTVSSAAIQVYNSSSFIEALSPDENEKREILQFLTKSQGYYTSEKGGYCQSHGVQCHYCNKALQGQYIPIYDYILNEYISNDYKGGLIKILSKTVDRQRQDQVNSESTDPDKVNWSKIFGDFMDDEVNLEVNKFYKLIRSSYEYVCQPTNFEQSQNKQFCSKKCLNEFSIFN